MSEIKSLLSENHSQQESGDFPASGPEVLSDSEQSGRVLSQESRPPRTNEPTMPGSLSNVSENASGSGNRMPVFPGNDNLPNAPVAGDSGRPAVPGGSNTPSTPIAPGGGRPVFPSGGSNIPSTPIAPGGGRPVAPGPSRPQPPTLPGIPVRPVPPVTLPAQFGQVRFLNASTNNFPVTIFIDNRPYALNFSFGSITGYDRISDGFHTVSVRRSQGPRTLLYQQSLPFIGGERVTMVLVDTGMGIDLIRVSDAGCATLPFNSGCYRFANMTFPGSSYDLMTSGGNVVFGSVPFPSVTSYKQAVAGSHQFFVTNSSGFLSRREIPIIVIGAVSPNRLVREPLVSFQVDIAPRRRYTTYLIGNSWSGFNLRALTVAD